MALRSPPDCGFEPIGRRTALYFVISELTEAATASSPGAYSSRARGMQRKRCYWLLGSVPAESSVMMVPQAVEGCRDGTGELMTDR
jgi:hypothetical protein